MFSFEHIRDQSKLSNTEFGEESESGRKGRGI